MSCRCTSTDERAQEEPGQTADGEEKEERESVEHRGLEADRSLVHRGQPVEDLDGRGDGDGEGQEAEDHVGQRGLAAHEHVMSPDQEPDHGDRDRAEGDEAVAEDVLAAEDRDQLGNDAHSGQDHDVDRRMGVEPEEVLVEDRVASQTRVEDADPQGAFGDQEKKGDPEDRRGQHLDDGGRVEAPEEEGHAEPAHLGRAELVDRDDEVDPGEDRAEAENEDAEDDRDHAAVGRRAVRGVEGPSGVDPAGHDGENGEERPGHVEVPARQVQPGEGDVLGSEHEGKDEVPQRSGNARDQHQEDHHRPVQGEDPVVGLGRHRRVLRLDQHRPDDHGQDASEEEGGEDRDQIEHPDPLVIQGAEPGAEPVAVREVVVLAPREKAGVASAGRAHCCASSNPVQIGARRAGASPGLRTPPRSLQCLQILDDLGDLLVRHPPLVGRHDRVESRHHLRRRIENRSRGCSPHPR